MFKQSSICRQKRQFSSYSAKNKINIQIQICKTQTVNYSLANKKYLKKKVFRHAIKNMKIYIFDFLLYGKHMWSSSREKKSYFSTNICVKCFCESYCLAVIYDVFEHFEDTRFCFNRGFCGFFWNFCAVWGLCWHIFQLDLFEKHCRSWGVDEQCRFCGLISI